MMTAPQANPSFNFAKPTPRPVLDSVGEAPPVSVVLYFTVEGAWDFNEDETFEFVVLESDMGE